MNAPRTVSFSEPSCCSVSFWETIDIMDTCSSIVGACLCSTTVVVSSHLSEGWQQDMRIGFERACIKLGSLGEVHSHSKT